MSDVKYSGEVFFWWCEGISKSHSKFMRKPYKMLWKSLELFIGIFMRSLVKLNKNLNQKKNKVVLKQLNCLIKKTFEWFFHFMSQYLLNLGWEKRIWQNFY